MKKRKCACQDELIDIPAAETGRVEETAVPTRKPRKPNAWITLCKEVQSREENVGKSYREIMKIAKSEYRK